VLDLKDFTPTETNEPPTEVHQPLPTPETTSPPEKADGGTIPEQPTPRANSY
jgi:hypothetical protein